VLTADTNVWARALLNDEDAQGRTARSALADARSADGVFVPLIVLAELSWVLRGQWERQRVLDAIERMLQTRGITVESPDVARKALEAAAKGGAVGFADHLIAEVSFQTGASEIITFDKAFGKLSRIRRL
jgi:predicted nucleic-acid-binding protein